MKKNLINEVKQLQKLAGILKENHDGHIKVGDKVSYRYEGEPSESGTVVDIANNWNEALRKGGDNFDQWEDLFNSEEYALDMGYDSLEDWQNMFANKLKSGIWYKIEGDEHSDSGGWFPAEYID